MDIIDLYIFRHGQTDWNALKKIQGTCDIPLNETGRTQAKELANKISLLNLQVLFSSDLLRAKQTSEIISSELKIEAVYNIGLREINCGKAEGRFVQEFWNEMGESFFNKWISSNPVYWEISLPDGETKQAALNRARSSITDFIDRNKFSKIGIFTHGGILEYLVLGCENRPEEVSLKNCVLYHINFIKSKNRWNFISIL